MNVTFDRPGWSYEILKALHVFHQQEEYCDVVVVCNDKKIRAHSCVLAAASPWVASELQCGSSEGPVQIVSLEDTPSQVVQYIMTFVYTGQFKVPLKHIKEAQSLASRLGIRCLKDRDEDDDGSGDEGSHGDHGNHGDSPSRDIPARDTPVRARGAGRRGSDLEHRVPDSSLPSDTVVTLNRDWCEADSTPSASQSDSTPSVSQSTSLTLPSSSTPDPRVPTPALSHLSQTPLPGTSRSCRLKRAAQDHEDIKPDTPPKRKRGRPRKSTPLAPPPVATATLVNRSVTDVDSATRPQALPETLGTEMIRTDQLKQDSDNDSFHDDDPPDTSFPDNSIPDDGIQDDQEANHSEGGKQAARDVNKGKKKRKRKCATNQFKGEDGKYHCPDCDKVYLSSGSFNEHRRKHADNYRYNCDVCNRGFMSKCYYKSHALTHLNVYAFPCDQCDKGFVHNKDLKQHIAADHNDVKYLCSKCGTTFRRMNSLRSHVKFCVHGIIEQCPYCPYTTKFKTNLTTHKKRMHCDYGDT